MTKLQYWHLVVQEKRLQERQLSNTQHWPRGEKGTQRPIEDRSLNQEHSAKSVCRFTGIGLYRWEHVSMGLVMSVP